MEGSGSAIIQWVSNYDAETVLRDSKILTVGAQAGKVGNYAVRN